MVDARSVAILLMPASGLRAQSHDIGPPVAGRAVHLQQSRRLPRLAVQGGRALTAAVTLDQEPAVCDLHLAFGVQKADRARRRGSIGAVSRDRHLYIILPIARARDLEEADPLARDARD